jgi:hypothetical protein
VPHNYSKKNSTQEATSSSVKQVNALPGSNDGDTAKKLRIEKGVVGNTNTLFNTSEVKTDESFTLKLHV